jgi:hypothetical protein
VSAIEQVMGRGVRRAALTAHVAVSVGWFGAVVVSLGLAAEGLLAPDPDTVRAVWLSLDLVGWWTLVPLSLLSLTTGLVQALGTRWGVLRHYWVVVKLVLNLIATGVLLLYTQTLDALADAARHASTPSLVSGDLVDASPLVHSLASLLLLLGAIVLSIFKPRGLTSYGMRQTTESSAGHG